MGLSVRGLFPESCVATASWVASGREGSWVGVGGSVIVLGSLVICSAAVGAWTQVPESQVWPDAQSESWVQGGLESLQLLF